MGHAPTLPHTILVKVGASDTLLDWQDCFRAVDPRWEVRWWDDPAVKPEDVAYVLVWSPEPGRLARLPNLRAVFSSGAGVDHITADPAWPRHLPLVRMGGAGTAQRMGEYVTWACLTILRQMPVFIRGQAAHDWRHRQLPWSAPDRTVGIMGLGNLGTRCAEMLRGSGFRVQGWSRSRKKLPGVCSFVGEAERAAFLRGSDILVNLLPATPDTMGLLDAATLSLLPTGAGVVNAARGTHLVTADLLALLDAGRLSAAVLDVFEAEPLEPDSLLWDHPAVVVTPHVASMASRQERAAYVAAAIAEHEAGRPMPNRYDHARLY